MWDILNNKLYYACSTDYNVTPCAFIASVVVPPGLKRGTAYIEDILDLENSHKAY